MPRNSAGTYSLPEPPFVAGTVIDPAAVNSDFSDIGSALTGSLARNGDGGMTGQLKAADGTLGAPGYTWGNDLDSGFYRVGANSFAAVVGGAAAYTIASTGNVTFAFDVAVTGALSGASVAATGAITGASATLTSTDAGAAAAPLATLDRNSASPAASDVVGAVVFSGRDDGGGTNTYAQVQAEIVDPAAGSEDGALAVQTVIAGTLATRGKWGAGLYMTGATGGDQGPGTINATAVCVNGTALTSGKLVQRVYATYTTQTNTSTTVPNDTSIPQNTEGAETVTGSITPTNASNIIRVTCRAPVSGNAAGFVVLALFVDSTADALAVTGAACQNNVLGTGVLVYEVVAGSTSARTYKLRVGPDASTLTTAYINRTSGTALYGGAVVYHSMIIEEITP